MQKGGYRKWKEKQAIGFAVEHSTMATFGQKKVAAVREV